MKTLALFLALFFGIFYYFGSDEVRVISEHRQIAQSPGFVPAIPDGMTGATTKKSSTYRAHFKYVVEGKSYRLTTTSTNEEGARRYAQENHQVVYDTRDPSVSTLKRYFELRDRGNGAYFRALFLTGVLSLLLSLPLTLLGAWRLGWLRKAAKRVLPQAFGKA